MLSAKISVALFPIVILLFAWWKRRRIGWNDLKLATPFLGISLVLGNKRTLLGGRLVSAFPFANDGSCSGWRFFCATGSRRHLDCLYFFKCIWPVGLLPIYPKWRVDPPSLLQFLPWLILVGVIVGLWTRRESWGRHALLGLGFFLINLAPFLGPYLPGHIWDFRG